MSFDELVSLETMNLRGNKFNGKEMMELSI